MFFFLTAQIEQLGLTDIHNYMTLMLGWPIMGSNPGGNWNASTSLEDLMILVRKGSNSLPVIDFGVTQDDKNPENHILAVSGIIYRENSNSDFLITHFK